MHVAKSSVTVRWCWVTADLCVEQVFMAEIAVTEACCQLFLQSRIEPETLFPVVETCAVHQCWAFAHTEPVEIFFSYSCTGASLLWVCFAEQH